MRSSLGLVIVTGPVALLAACKSDNEGTRACATAAQCEAGEVCIDSLCRGCFTHAECPAPLTCGGGGVPDRCGCADHDGDGASCDDCNDQNPLVGPNAPAGFVANDTDCNDADPTMSPGRVEVCDFKDNDCNDAIDDGVTTTFYRDSDGDGFGDPANVVVGCIQPGGFVAVGGDCDDSRPDVHPDAAETCNARDDDCDGVVDGNTRSCDNACGAGVETCEAGLFTGCTAPTITTVSTLTQIKGVTLASYTCLLVKSRLVVDADTEINAANWIRVDQGGQIESGPRTKLSASSIAFVGNGALASPEVTLDAATISLEQDARWFIGDAAGVSYSAGGAAACTNGGGQSVGAGAGGARGGGGGKGGSCGAIGTQPRASRQAAMGAWRTRAAAAVGAAAAARRAATAARRHPARAATRTARLAWRRRRAAAAAAAAARR